MLNTYRKKREKRLFQQLAQFAGNQHATVIRSLGNISHRHG
jgi:hypothetical protein